MQRKRVYGGSKSKKSVKKYKRSSNNIIYKSVGSELKAVDINNAGAPPVTTLLSNIGGIFSLNFIGTGTDIYQRIGRKICMKSIHLKARLVSSGAVAVNDMVRLMIVYDRQANATTGPTAGDLFQMTDPSGATSTTVFDFKNPSNEDRFKVLWDESFSLPQNGVTMNDSVWKNNSRTYIDKYIKMDAEAHYVGGTNYPTTGGLFFVTYGSNAIAVAPTNVQWVARLRFTDV